MSTSQGDRLSLPGWLPALFAAVTFGVCVFYTYALLVLVPAPGFDALNQEWQVVAVSPSGAGRGLIPAGDRVLGIGDPPREQFLDTPVGVPCGRIRPGRL